MASISLKSYIVLNYIKIFDKLKSTTFCEVSKLRYCVKLKFLSLI